MKDRSTTLGVSCAALALVVLSLKLGAQQAPAPPPLVREGATVKLAPHTYVIPDFNVGAVPNVGIIVGGQGTLVIDPGLGRKNGETVLREVAKVSSNQALYIASTHFHPEHTTGYVAFPASAKYINSRTQENEFAESGMQMVQTFAGMSATNADLLKDAARRPADITFDRDYLLDLGGVRVRFVLVGPTHTKGDTGFFVEGDNVLFAGDVVMNQSFVAASAVSSMKAWLAAFDTFDAFKPQTVVPSHGPVGAGSLVETNRQVMLAIQARARALKAQGQSVDAAVSTIQSEFQTQHPTWARANGIGPAARSAYAEAP